MHIRGKTIQAARCSVLLILAFFPSHLKAEQEALTLEEAVRQALVRNERSLSADKRVSAAEARVTKARAYFLPNLDATGAYTRRPFEVVRTINDQQVTIQSYNALSGVVALNLTIFDSRGIPAYRQARSERAAEWYAAAESKRKLAFEVGGAFLTTLSTDQVRDAARRRLEFAKQNLDAARARFAAGLVSVNDVTRAELEYATADRGVIQVEGQVETTYLQLGYLLGDQGPVRKRLSVPELLIRAADDRPAAPETLVAEAQDRRLDLNSLRRHAEAQRALTLEPILNWLPALGFTSQYRYTNEAGLTSKSTTWNVGLTLTWAIFDGFGRNADYKESRAMAAIADLEVTAAMRRVEIEVRDALVSVTTQRASLKQAEVAHTVAVKNATETTELYRQGLASALEVADANVRLFEAEVEVVKERYGLGLSYLNLEAALGLDPFGKEPIRL